MALDRQAALERRCGKRTGTIIRSMQVVLTYAGQDPITRSRREVITYDGSDTATIVITHNGETRTCQLPLPRGRPDCG